LYCSGLYIWLRPFAQGTKFVLAIRSFFIYICYRSNQYKSYFKQHTRMNQNYITQIGILPQFDKKYRGQVDMGITKWSHNHYNIIYFSKNALPIHTVIHIYIGIVQYI